MRRLRAVADDPGVGSEAALRAAYAAHGAELYRYALRQLRDDGAAQEAVQEVFLRAWRRADTFDESIAGLRVWLFAIARNVVVDEVRRLAVRPWRQGLTDDPEAAAPAVDPMDSSVIDAWLVDADPATGPGGSASCGRPARSARSGAGARAS